MSTIAQISVEPMRMRLQPKTKTSFPAQDNGARHNRLLSQFRIYWNIYQFLIEINPQNKPELATIQQNFASAFQKFKRCKTSLNLQPDSEEIVLQLETLECDVEAIRDFLQENDSKVSVCQIRQALESKNQAGEGIVKHLLEYSLSKHKKLSDDRDKIDYLITLHFQHEFKSLINMDSLSELELEILPFLSRSEDAQQLVPPEFFDQCMVLVRELYKIVEFSDFLHKEIIAKIREFKQTLGDFFYHPSLLARIIVLNTAVREKFEALLAEENQKTEEHIIKLAEAGGEIVVENNEASPLAGLNLLKAKELKHDLTENLHEEYSRTLEKIRVLDQLSNTLERSVAYYGLNVKDTKVGASFALKFNDKREEDDLRNMIADLGMMVRAHTGKSSTVVRFKYRDILVILSAWEVDAFREGPLSSDTHLRIRQAVRRTVGLIFAIQDILRQFKELATNNMPRHLLLTLEYYLLKTQEMQSSLQELMEDTIRSGMKVETFHLSNTQSRLAATMALIKPLFRQSGM